jgi:hypothetical protein
MKRKKILIIIVEFGTATVMLLKILVIIVWLRIFSAINNYLYLKICPHFTRHVIKIIRKIYICMIADKT